MKKLILILSVILPQFVIAQKLEVTRQRVEVDKKYEIAIEQVERLIGFVEKQAVKEYLKTGIQNEEAYELFITQVAQALEDYKTGISEYEIVIVETEELEAERAALNAKIGKLSGYSEKNLDVAEYNKILERIKVIDNDLKTGVVVKEKIITK